MKIYLAHNYAAKHIMNLLIPDIEHRGHTVTSRWVYETDSKEIPLLEAAKDLHDLSVADIVFFFANQYGNNPGRGKFVELGVALSLEKKIFAIDANLDDCVFYHLPEVIVVPDMLDALNYIEEVLVKEQD